MSLENNHTHLDFPSLLRENENYKLTVDALVCFISLVTFDNDSGQRIDGTKYSLGRRMNTSPENFIQPETEITPDAVIQRDSSLGFVVEGKASLPEDFTRWERVIEQIIKYNDDLTGWWTESNKIKLSNSVLLLFHEHTPRFVEILEGFIEENNLTLPRPLSVVSVLRQRDAVTGEYIHLERNFGEIVAEDNDVETRLRYGIRVPLEKVKANSEYQDYRFYDSEPTPEYTMEILWQHVFTSMKSREVYDEESNRYWLEVNVEDLKNDLQIAYGNQSNNPREVSYPLVSWVRNAMDAFVRINLATKVDADNYIVEFYELQSELFERFHQHRGKGGIGTTPDGQIGMFNDGATDFD